MSGNPENRPGKPDIAPSEYSIFFKSDQADPERGGNTYSVVYVSVPTIAVGKVIGFGLLENKFAASVNLIPLITSIYEKEGRLDEHTETLLIIKTRTNKVDVLTDFVRSNHPYRVCEVLSLPIQNGNPAYLQWIGETVPENTNVNGDDTMVLED